MSKKINTLNDIVKSQEIIKKRIDQSVLSSYKKNTDYKTNHYLSNNGESVVDGIINQGMINTLNNKQVCVEKIKAGIDNYLTFNTSTMNGKFDQSTLMRMDASIQVIKNCSLDDSFMENLEFILNHKRIFDYLIENKVYQKQIQYRKLYTDMKMLLMIS